MVQVQLKLVDMRTHYVHNDLNWFWCWIC